MKNDELPMTVRVYRSLSTMPGRCSPVTISYSRVQKGSNTLTRLARYPRSSGIGPDVSSPHSMSMGESCPL